jgi:reactive intermediate/imine deaminase
VTRQTISTTTAPAAIGTYSQAVRVGDTVYLAGQIALDSETMMMCNATIEDEIHQVFSNLREGCMAAGGSLAGIAKLNLYLTDLSFFSLVNEIMGQYFRAPYPARAAIGVAALPRGARVEADGVLVLCRK